MANNKRNKKSIGGIIGGASLGLVGIFAKKQKVLPNVASGLAGGLLGKIFKKKDKGRVV